MTYGRDYLETAIPAATTEATDPQGLLEGEEQQKWSDGFEEVLATIRAEFKPGHEELTDGEVTDAVFIACNAWDTYCGVQGDVAATLRAVRAEL